jgi:Spy/CpxP family protein refolding chaperone
MPKLSFLHSEVRMHRNRFAQRVAVAIAFLLCAVPSLTRAQGNPPPTPVPAPRAGAPIVQSKRIGPSTEDFAGLQYTDQQKVQIAAIHKDVKQRMDNVAKDDKLTTDQKEAMLEGYRRLENNQIFAVLTPEQQNEVRKKLAARRAAEQEEFRKRQRAQSQLPDTQTPTQAPPAAPPHN